MSAADVINAAQEQLLHALVAKRTPTPGTGGFFNWPHRSPDFVWTAEQADDWRKPWPGFTRTRYEAKAVREGRTPCYLIFKRR